MVSRRLRFAAVTLLATGLAAATASAASLSDLSFMSGCWKGKLAKGGTVEERYNAPTAGLMLGTSHTIENDKTRYFEFIRIEQKGEEVWMTPMPGGKASVSFKLVRLEGKRAVFENLEHDFPKRIIYGLKEDGTLLARIEGDKPEKAMEFPMQPIACAGTNLANFGLTWGESGSDIGQYDNPSGIAVYKDWNGTVSVVLTDTNNHRLRAFTGTGMFIEKWGETGGGPGQFNYPQGVAVNSKLEMIVADAGNHRIEVTNGPPIDMQHLPGEPVRSFGREGSGDGELRNPLAVAVDAEDNIYVADTDNHRIQKFTRDGKFLARWGSRGGEPGQLNLPSGIAVDRRGSVYVVDTDNQRIQKFDLNGKFLAQWGTGGGKPGQFYRPKGAALDGEGNLYVADCNNHRVQKFDPTGRFLGAFGTGGAERGELSFPAAVAVDDAGNIYVTDSGNDRIQVFRENRAVAQLYREGR
jgi:DNA-binding beta-propeller fold protein YncE